MNKASARARGNPFRGAPACSVNAKNGDEDVAREYRHCFQTKRPQPFMQPPTLLPLYSTTTATTVCIRVQLVHKCSSGTQAPAAAAFQSFDTQRSQASALSATGAHHCSAPYPPIPPIHSPNTTPPPPPPSSSSSYFFLSSPRLSTSSFGSFQMRSLSSKGRYLVPAVCTLRHPGALHIYTSREIPPRIYTYIVRVNF